MTVLSLILINSLICVGFYVACSFDGDEDYDLDKNKKAWTTIHGKMLLWWVRYYGGRVIPEFWTKPLYSCLPCMGSLHSIAPTVLYCYGTNTNFVIWPLVALATVGLNYLITIVWK